MKIIKTIDKYSIWRNKQKKSIGFVPTLGAIHKGHLSLIKKSIKLCSNTVVSIFLNPTQFAPNEDLNSYPKTLDADIELLKTLNINILFLPDEREMYEKSSDVNIHSNDFFNKLEGKSRPHFFYGVTTIVAKLFNAIKPTHTFFGKKDAQQLLIIKKMIKEMQYNIKLIDCSTIRNQNGLALSSRNQYLNQTEQKQASVIYQGLMKIKSEINKGEKNPKKLKLLFKDKISEVSKIKLDYISIANIDNLEEITIINNQKILISAAVYFNNVRLIDNFIYSAT